MCLIGCNVDGVNRLREEVRSMPSEGVKELIVGKIRGRTVPDVTLSVFTITGVVQSE